MLSATPNPKTVIAYRYTEMKFSLGGKEQCSENQLMPQLVPQRIAVVLEALILSSSLIGKFGCSGDKVVVLCKETVAIHVKVAYHAV